VAFASVGLISIENSQGSGRPTRFHRLNQVSAKQSLIDFMDRPQDPSSLRKFHHSQISLMKVLGKNNFENIVPSTPVKVGRLGRGEKSLNFFLRPRQDGAPQDDHELGV